MDTIAKEEAAARAAAEVRLTWTLPCPHACLRRLGLPLFDTRAGTLNILPCRDECTMCL